MNNNWLHFYLVFVLKVAFFFVINLSLFAQVQYGGKPAGIKYNIFNKDIETVEISLSSDKKQEMKSKEGSGKAGEAMHAGFSLPASLNPDNSGSWEKIGDSLWIWRVRIHSPNALALGLVFDKFELSENSKMFVYCEDKEVVLGSFDHRNNNNEQFFTTQIIPSETIVVEYEEFVSRENPNQKPNNITLNISELIYVIDGGGVISKTAKGIGNSGNCNVNVNCPEGDNWQKQKRSIARMLIKADDSYYWCSGALVNNTSQDTTPYFLSAYHCRSDADEQDMIYWHFYFNFERPGCEDIGVPQYNMMHGCQLVSEGSIDGGSDFILLKLRENLPSEWEPFYSGWSLGESASDEGVSIHHPAGDVKKISTYEKTLKSTSPSIGGNQMADNSVWQVEWAETQTDYGVTEGGSSGSPLFNDQGLIIGTLSGGVTTCDEPGESDYYGKFNYHWESNDPDDLLKQLRPYLDPVGESVTDLEGFDPYFVEYPPPGFLTASKQNEEDIRLKWYKPGSTPNDPGWYSHIVSLSHFTWKGVERATLFDAKYFDFTFPIHIEKVSHRFYEHEEHEWDNDKFRFKIYNSAGTNLVYKSPELEASGSAETIYELNPSIIRNEKFYVAVTPVGNNEYPSSSSKRVNYGSGHSFTGSADNWTLYADHIDNTQFEYLTKIYITNNGDKESVKSTTGLQEKNDDYSLSGNVDHFTKEINNTPENYRVYRDNVLIYTTETGEDKTFLDESPGNGFYEYYVTAVYNNTGESEPSNIIYVLLADPCAENIDDYPYNESFDAGELDDCWKIIEQSTNSWQFTTGYSVNSTEIEPVEGEQFVYVPWTDDQPQDEWLITSLIDFSMIDNPALKFWFNGSYTSSAIEENSSLSVYVSIDDGAFHKAWGHSMHPEFNSSHSDYEWLQALVNLSKYANEENVRIAFQYKGQNGANFAVDKIELIDASDLVYSVSLNVAPDYSGMVIGEDSYIAGETVTIKAYPNIEYIFSDWQDDDSGAKISSQQEYSFSMPENDVSLTANFSYNVVVEDVPLQLERITGYPNPVRNEYNILFNERLANVTVRIYNLQGVLIRSYDYSLIDPGYELSINMNGLAKGIYLVNISSDDQYETLKVRVVD